MSKKQQFNYVTFGSKVNSEQISLFLNYMLDANVLNPDATDRPTPICIWGMHGIGKTELVQAIAADKNCAFTYIAPAQFEEMGDLIGMPKIIEKADNELVTQLVPPEWTPKKEGPGIFLIDDVNRADDRILRGIMQLLQNYELVSWKFPKGWQIVLTANPDGGDYSVTTMDDAILTRMMHVTMEFDAKSWAKWAESAGIDPRGISFVLTYPEIVSGRRTTPRSLVQFFKALKPLKNLKESLEMVKLLADGCLDPETTLSFISFINMDLEKLVLPEEILNATDFKAVETKIKNLVEGQTKRMDILSVIMTRLTNYLLVGKTDLTDKQFNHLKNFILLPLIPNDLRLAMAQDIVKSPRKALKKLYAVPEIAKLLLTKM